MKIKINTDISATPTFLVSSAIFFWIIYSCIYSLLKSNPSTILLSGYLPLIGEAGLDIVVAGLTVRLWYKAKCLNNRKLFFIFFLAFVAAVFADGVYNIALNLYEFQYANPLVILMFELPFSLFLLFQSVAWTYILFINKESAFRINKSVYVPYLVVSVLMFAMFMFGVKWQIQYFSVKGVFQSIDTIFAVIGFSMATICLARAQTFLIRISSIGFLLIVSSDFIIRYHVVTGLVPYLSSFESTWVLGLILLTLGFYLVKDDYDEKLFILSPINSLQSQIGIWSLVLWLISAFMFAGTYYFFSPGTEPSINLITKNFLSMLIPFSVLAIISSSYLSIKISSPLSKLECRINEFLRTDTIPEETTNLTDNGYIFEFKALEKFVFDAFGLYQVKHLTDMQFAQLAAQVAHDIRSPLAAINTAVLNVTDISENRRIMIRNASKRINDIANNLLFKSKSIFYEGTIEEGDGSVRPELIFVVVDNIVAEKRYEYYKSKIDIKLKVSENSYNCFSNINIAPFNRVLSNLINNSVESINGDGLITISIVSNLRNIRVSIEDNGCGIPAHIMQKVTERGFSFNKKNGAGFGLSYANQYIDHINGKLLIRSKQGIGTKITITLNQTERPNWFCQELYVKSNYEIVVLDDDRSIHDAWNERFNHIKNVKLTHFYNIKEFLAHKEERLKSFLYLIDYELVEDVKNGLDFIEELSLNDKALLVTSSFEDIAIRTRCEKMGVKIIPKSYVPYININQAQYSQHESSLVFIDNDEMMRTTWAFAASDAGKDIAVYSSIDEFFSVINGYSKDTVIYIDSDLDNNVKGELESKKLFDLGFTEIHLTTGHAPNRYENMPWLKSIVGKSPPF